MTLTNMRRILDAFWPNESLDAQLRKTWTTNAVLCPAEVSGGKHLARVEQACTQTYLARQLDLFPLAFILALGGKARDRMQAAGFRCNAVGLHPSARTSDADKLASWEAAARLFRGVLSDEIAPPEAARPPKTSSQRLKRAPQSLKPEVSSDLQDAIMALPPGIGDFLRRVIHHPDYDCQAGRMQLMVSFRGAKVGGLNRQAAHWYFSKVFVRDHGDPDIMATHGFRHVVHNAKHGYWMAQGLGAQAGFEAAMVAMTGVRP